MLVSLLDAGPIIALLWAPDPHHESTVGALKQCASSGRTVATTWEAVSEAFTLIRSRVSRRGGEQDPALGVLTWAWQSGITVIASNEVNHRRCRDILERHGDIRLSYADALQLAIAEQLDVSEVITVDGPHFRAVRLRSQTVVTVV